MAEKPESQTREPKRIKLIGKPVRGVTAKAKRTAKAYRRRLESLVELARGRHPKLSR